MNTIYSKSKNNISVNIKVDEKYPDVALAEIEGAIFNNTVGSIKKIFEVLKEESILNLIIDLSRVNTISSEGWNIIINKYNNMDQSGNFLVLIRMRPFIYEMFKNLKMEENIPHYRTFKDALNYIVENTEESVQKVEENEYDNVNIEKKDSKQGEEEKEEKNKEENEEVEFDNDFPGEDKENFPLEKSRELSEKMDEGFEDEIIPSVTEVEKLEESTTFEGELGNLDDNLRKIIIREIFEWKAKGYNTEFLEKLIEEDFDKTKKIFGKYSSRIMEIKKMRDKLQLLDNTDFEEEVIELSQDLYNVVKFEDNKKNYNELMDRISKEREAKFNPIFQYSFDNFIKGTCNEYAYEIAEYVVNNLEEYNEPFYIFGPNGSGKTHILNAIGNKLESRFHRNIFYITGNRFINLYKKYRKRDEEDKLREFILNHKIVLFDDFQNIDNKKELKEFRNFYEAVKEFDMKLFITSTKKIELFNSISSDLLSRLSNSVFLKLDNVDERTFKNIIQNKFGHITDKIDDKINNILFEITGGDLRKSFGYLNTLEAFYKASNERITINEFGEILDIDLSNYTEEIEKKEYPEESEEIKEKEPIEEIREIEEEEPIEEIEENEDEEPIEETEEEKVEKKEKRIDFGKSFETERIDEDVADIKFEDEKRDLEEENRENIGEEEVKEIEKENTEIEDTSISQKQEVSFGVEGIEEEQIEEDKKEIPSEKTDIEIEKDFVEEKSDKEVAKDEDIIEKEDIKIEEEEPTKIDDEKVDEVEKDIQLEEEKEIQDLSEEEINEEEEKDEEELVEKSDKDIGDVEETVEIKESDEDVEKNKEEEEEEEKKEEKDENKDVMSFDDEADIDSDIFEDNEEDDELFWEDEEDDDEDFFE